MLFAIFYWISQTWHIILRIQEWMSCSVLLDSKETQIVSRNQEACPSVGKCTVVVLEPCCAWKCVPTTISSCVDVLETYECHLLRQMIPQLDSQNFNNKCLIHSQSTFLIVAHFLTRWNGHWVNETVNFESRRNSLKFSFTNIQGPQSIFVDLESFL